FMLASDSEKYDINGITSQYGYAIINKDEGDEHKTQNTLEEMVDYIVTFQDTDLETSNLTTTEDEKPAIIQPHFDNEFTYLNTSPEIKTASNSEFYSTDKIVEEYIEKITII